MVAFTIRKKDRNATDTCRDNDFFTGSAAAPRRAASPSRSRLFCATTDTRRHYETRFRCRNGCDETSSSGAPLAGPHAGVRTCLPANSATIYGILSCKPSFNDVITPTYAMSRGRTLPSLLPSLYSLPPRAGKTERRLANMSREGRPLPEVEIDLRWIEGARG